MNKKISSTLLYLARNVSLRFHVSLTKKGRDGITDIPNAFHTVYENSNGKYITYDVRSYLTLEIKDKSEYWDGTSSIMISPANLFQVLTHISRMIGNIYMEDCFYIDSQNETRVNQDKIDEYTVRAFNLGPTQRMLMYPSVIYEKTEETLYEGATFELNNSRNAFSLAIDVIESFYYTLGKVDFFTYTHVLLDYYFAHVYKEEENEPVVDTSPRRGHVFTNVVVEDINPKEQEEEQLKSSLKKEKESSEEFFGM